MKHTLKPGETAEVKVVFNTKDAPGPFRKTITVTPAGSDQEAVKMTIEGTVREAPAPKIQVAPRKAALGTHPTGTVQRKEFSVENIGSQPLIVTRVASREGGSVYFDAKSQGDMIIAPGQAKTIALDVKIAQKGDGQELVVIESNAKNAGKRGYVIVITYKGE